MKIKRVILGILIPILLLGVANYFVQRKYGPIAIREALSATYTEIPESQFLLLETRYFEMPIPDSWWYLPSGYGIEGDPYGVLNTGEGIIHYEYGYFAPGYEEDSHAYRYVVEERVINGLVVNIARRGDGEIGISIPKQNTMNSKLTFYLSEEVFENFDDLMRGIEGIVFK